MTFALQPDESPGDALRRVAAETLDDTLSLIQAGAAPGGDPHHAVHETRKAGKRLRALLRMYRPGLGERYDEENAAVRDAGRELSDWRDYHVLPQTCAKLSEELGIDRESLASAEGAHLEPERTVNDALWAAGQRLEAIRWRVPDWRARRPRHSAAAGVAADYRQGRKRLRGCKLNGPAEPWHAWRKSVKRHLYHAELLAKLHPAGRGYEAPWDELAKLLGDEHDLSVLLLRIGDAKGDDTAELVDAAESRRRRLRKKARKLGRQLYWLKPRLVEQITLALLKG